jgi:hypothetical protein
MLPSSFFRPVAPHPLFRFRLGDQWRAGILNPSAGKDPALPKKDGRTESNNRDLTPNPVTCDLYPSQFAMSYVAMSHEL